MLIFQMLYFETPILNDFIQNMKSKRPFQILIIPNVLNHKTILNENDQSG